eukprot:NODE_826_length_3874_cov_0.571656.p1 type:complete len:509 gc:universal NODE_826_length_3874_cov_0.571656:697-2223(+)
MISRQLKQLKSSCRVQEQHSRPLLTNKGPSFLDFLKKNNLKTATNGQGTSYFVKIYGCQMNVNDTEVFNSIMASNNYKLVNNMDDASIVFLMTCAIRENAESKIWQQINVLKKVKKRVAILGCMAENLKNKLLEKVDLIAGPDSYKSVPNLLNALDMNPGLQGIGNVQLSIDETYADIKPLRIDTKSKSAFISITRGCNNMCSFCIVPFTRGVERSTSISVIIDEVKRLRDSGIKEITLLGQNVNSYVATGDKYSSYPHHSNPQGFTSLYSPKNGLRFINLLDQVSLAAPSVRFRFTSPHPKDFPIHLLQLIKDRDNICKQIHLPLQSGNTLVLDKMRRGYSKEAYLNLAQEIRHLIPNATISTDIIVGFCGETEEAFLDTLDVVDQVKFELAYTFIYSMRSKTHAFHNYKDNVPEDTKVKRLNELVNKVHDNAKTSLKRFVNSTQKVLVSGKGKKVNQYKGRTDVGISTHFDSDAEIATGSMVDVRIINNSSASFESELLKPEANKF